ncbi:complement C1q subcomponent subunit B-like [Cyprinodon tularosa]|uniref:complement C1q subcomponent subunit B-like n=1 Tax=Cyprinodon tularosa TaxID=77115 RepID=UPI0018E23E37|nr:complement C1q subcomponent subunit B-like [Cyprinodon tularosa]
MLEGFRASAQSLHQIRSPSPTEKMRSSLFLVAVLLCGLVSAQQDGLPERVQKLESDNDVWVKSRVAFAAALFDTDTWTSMNESTADRTLEFKKVVTNIGKGYDPQTGIFTAPVKGLYYIQVSGVVGNNGQLNAGLKKNRELMFAIYQKSGLHTSASNGMTLALEQGDQLYVQLWKGQTIADQGRLSTFTGFLVFPM